MLIQRGRLFDCILKYIILKLINIENKNYLALTQEEFESWNYSKLRYICEEELDNKDKN